MPRAEQPIGRGDPFASARSAVAVACAVTLVSCGSASIATSTATSGSAQSSAAPRETPALVQVENSSAARPQWGLERAAVVYEYVTEGGISRFSALYTAPPNGRVGPVRSARRVTVRLAQLYGAVVVYSGASAPVQQALDTSGLPHIDEGSADGDLYRIGERTAPHNLVTDGGHLVHLLQSFSGRTTPTPSLWPRTTPPAQDQGREVARFTVPVSTSETPTFTYDAASGGWSRSETDTGTFVDADSGAPVVAATVIVQQVAIEQTSDVEDINGSHGVDLILNGSGQAQVFSPGREYDVSWTQPPSGPPTFTLPGGGSPPIAQGMVWICLVATGSRAAAS